jgi:hypothetical protein
MADDWGGGYDAVRERSCGYGLNGDERYELCGSGEDVVEQLLERVGGGCGPVDHDAEYWQRYEWGFNADDCALGFERGGAGDGEFIVVCLWGNSVRGDDDEHEREQLRYAEFDCGDGECLFCGRGVSDAGEILDRFGFGGGHDFGDAGLFGGDKRGGDADDCQCGIDWGVYRGGGRRAAGSVSGYQFDADDGELLDLGFGGVFRAGTGDELQEGGGIRERLYWDGFVHLSGGVFP